jgi:lambda family phage portal protein
MGTELIRIEQPENGGEQAFGGGLEGASRFSRETASWRAPQISPDQAINLVKPEIDARGRDLAMNDGLIAGGVALHKDSIVGAQFRLNAKPDWRVLGADADWAEEFSIAAESRFNLAAEYEDCWLDASGKLTFTGMVRLIVGAFVYTGEVLATCEWIKDGRPLNTAIQLVSPDRLSNPDGVSDDRNLRRGVLKNSRGKPLGYYIRQGHPTEWYDNKPNLWSFIPAAKPWGRRQVIHILEPQQVDQTRGIAEMVAALKHARMTKKFTEITLQNAVINASYAAAIESELPNAEVITAMGGGAEGYEKSLAQYMTMLTDYLGGSENVQIDGAKIPHFFPGTKLNLKPMGTPGGVGSDFEASLVRKLAATLGLSYEEFSRDIGRASYSGLKAAIAMTGRSMGARKRMVADRFANMVYQLWVEEEIGAKNLPLPAGRNRTDFYRDNGMAKAAYTRCSWTGSGRGQIDELKETQAAMLRVKAGLSTYEEECAKLGKDWREVFEQLAREKKMIQVLGIEVNLDATAKGKQGAANTLKGDGQGDGNANDPNAAPGDVQDSQDNADA